MSKSDIKRHFFQSGIFTAEGQVSGARAAYLWLVSRWLLRERSSRESSRKQRLEIEEKNRVQIKSMDRLIHSYNFLPTTHKFKSIKTQDNEKEFKNQT